MLDSITEFAVNGRRALEAYGVKENIFLNQPRWTWKPTSGNEKVGELREAFNNTGWMLDTNGVLLDWVDRGGYFPAASNSFTFPITAKASAT